MTTIKVILVQDEFDKYPFKLSKSYSQLLEEDSEFRFENLMLSITQASQVVAGADELPILWTLWSVI